MIYDNPKAVWTVQYKVHYHDEQEPLEAEKIHIYEYERELSIEDLKREVECSVYGVIPSQFSIIILSVKRDVY